MITSLTRRRFLATTATASVGLTFTESKAAAGEKPALLGGNAARSEPFPSWPVFDHAEEQALVNTLRTGHWFRGSGKNVNRFEETFAELLGGKFCIGTSSGTSALVTSLNALGVGAGDEVLLGP